MLMTNTTSNAQTQAGGLRRRLFSMNCRSRPEEALIHLRFRRRHRHSIWKLESPDVASYFHA
jgi:hypothetical protein